MPHRLLTTTAAVAFGLFSSVATAETLRFGASADIYGFDPHGVTSSYDNIFVHNIYEPLVRYSPQLEIEPALATHWEIIEPTRIRYFLREGVTFHGGETFDAEDVAVSLMRAVHPNSPLRGNLPGLVDVEIVDDLTVDLILSGPSPLLNNFLTNIFIMDAGWMRENNAVEPIDANQGEEGFTTSNANGTGPFMVESRRPDSQTVLVVHSDWWDEPQHNLTRIEHRPISSAATRVAALLSGEIDLIQPAPLQDAARVEAAPGVRMLENPGLRTIMMGFNLTDTLNDGNVEENPLQDIRVRRAIKHAIDIDLIQERIMRGKSRNTAALIAPEVPGFAPELNERLPNDPDLARELLAEAGYPDGFAFNVNCTNDNYVNDEGICQAMAAMLARVGLEPRLVAEPRQLHFERAQAGRTDMFMLGWATLPMLDGFSVLSAMLHTPEGSYGTWNPGQYSNPRVDELTQAIAVELDEEARIAMMVEAFSIAKEDLAWLPLHQQPLAWAAREGVEIHQSADDLARLWTVRINR